VGESEWLLAFRYSDMETAGPDYDACRDLVFGLDIDASAYRIQVGGVVHVVVLGEQALLPPVREMFERACTGGRSVELPADIASALFKRRRTGKIPGAFWERRSL
jgi:hypothetical protein